MIFDDFGRFWGLFELLRFLEFLFVSKYEFAVTNLNFFDFCRKIDHQTVLKRPSEVKKVENWRNGNFGHYFGLSTLIVRI